MKAVILGLPYYQQAALPELGVVVIGKHGASLRNFTKKQVPPLPHFIVSGPMGSMFLADPEFYTIVFSFLVYSGTPRARIYFSSDG